MRTAKSHRNLRAAGLLAAAVVAALAVASPQAWAQTIIGHRGASGERPEHTRSSYELAIDQGADFIEPDLVMTRDGQFIARHENEIGGTTDVASHPEFAARKTTKVIDGRTIEGWFTEDFTLAELRTLRARERLPQLRPSNAAHDGADGLLTLDEVIDIAEARGKATGRVVGVYAELKHPTYFAGVGLPMEARLVEVLKARGLTDRSSPFILQCFEPGALIKVRALLPVRTVLLMEATGTPADAAVRKDARTYAELARPEGLREVARYADGIGPDKQMIVPRDAEGRSQPATSLVKDAHAAGLIVHPYTFRDENYFLPAELRAGGSATPADMARHGDAKAEYLQFFALGVDGLFSDYPASAVAARKALRDKGSTSSAFANP